MYLPRQAPRARHRLRLCDNLLPRNVNRETPRCQAPSMRDGSSNRQRTLRVPDTLGSEVLSAILSRGFSRRALLPILAVPLVPEREQPLERVRLAFGQIM